ncbi:Bax inhibitor-1 family protein [Candidatus Methylocalor cossyra]|uniref:Modulator of FtsH protease YccA n=1 Tax=Candidatus Methylocalor cossyra TaxID=3108543 RepID=A0ABM9NH61_9GAMM
MHKAPPAALRSAAGSMATHRVFCNTYALLSFTLLFSALVAGASLVFHWPHPGLFLSLLGSLSLLFLTARFRNSALGLVCVFALTGFLGLTLGPLLNPYSGYAAHGTRLVLATLGGAGLSFLGLSGYALIRGGDFGLLGGALTAGSGACLAGITALGLGIRGLSLAVVVTAVALLAGLIRFQTCAIIRGGETHSIRATVTLYASLYTLFIGLLQILGFLPGDE